METEASIQSGTTEKWYNTSSPAVVVEVIGDDAWLRTSEIKERAVVYRHKGRMHVRRYKEFVARFKPHTHDTTKG